MSVSSKKCFCVPKQTFDPNLRLLRMRIILAPAYYCVEPSHGTKMTWKLPAEGPGGCGLCGLVLGFPADGDLVSVVGVSMPVEQFLCAALGVPVFFFSSGVISQCVKSCVKSFYFLMVDVSNDFGRYFSWCGCQSDKKRSLTR